jgi:tetratricopeptide (TPR) repeat protein
MTPQEIFALYEAGNFNEAMRAASDRLNDHPTDPETLFLVGQIYLKSQRHGLAYNFYERIAQLEPSNANAWNNMGHAMHGMQRYRKASHCFVRSLEAGGDRFAPYNNLILMHQNLGDTERAKSLFRMAHWLAENDNDLADCTGNVSLSLLATRQWATGWDAYEHLIRPDKLRKEVEYEPDLPRWDGSPGGEVVVYGEQGLGEEFLFASCIPDAMRDVSVIMDADPRLASLFRRSFGCTVYGTRFNVKRPWLKHHRPKAKCAIGSLARFYRRDERSFPRQPYLKPDPEKRAMARALLSQWPGRKIGLAWTGGKRHTREADRSLTIEQLEPILSIPGCTFVSLQYNGDYYEAPDQRIRHLPIFTQSKDYGDTAALVCELDMVVSVTTAVAFLAAAVGTPGHVLVPRFPTWHWPRHGDFPWAVLSLHRRIGDDWTSVISEVRQALMHSQREAAQ